MFRLTSIFVIAGLAMTSVASTNNMMDFGNSQSTGMDNLPDASNLQAVPGAPISPVQPGSNLNHDDLKEKMQNVNPEEIPNQIKENKNYGVSKLRFQRSSFGKDGSEQDSIQKEAIKSTQQKRFGNQQGGTDMQQGGFGNQQGDMKQGGPGNQQGVPDMQQGVPDMKQGGPGNQQGVPDMQQGGPGNQQNEENKFRPNKRSGSKQRFQRSPSESDDIESSVNQNIEDEMNQLEGSGIPQGDPCMLPNIPGMPPQDVAGMPPQDVAGMPPQNVAGMPPQNVAGMPPQDGPGMPPHGGPDMPLDNPCNVQGNQEKPQTNMDNQPKLDYLNNLKQNA